MNQRLSRYSILFEKGGKYFVYNSRRNNFFELSSAAYYFLKKYKDNPSLDIDDSENNFINLLEAKDIITDEESDRLFYEELKLLYDMRAFFSSVLSITIAPTIMCNLKCPYCFEVSKPKGIMDDDTIEKLIKFVESHEAAQHCHIVWFGGEPLLAMRQIKQIWNRLKELDRFKTLSHSLITNGTLISDEAIEFFRNNPLTSVQITFDGFRDNHNKKRFYSNGQGSFDDIISNLHKIVDETESQVHLRVNVDNSNSDDYITLYKFISSNFSGDRILIYPGILKANRGCESETFFTTKDHLAFNKRMAMHKIPMMRYPDQCSKGCCATFVSSYVIGPQGELYNCWEHVGKPEKIIGNIASDELTNKKLFTEFISNGHCFNDPKCRECGLLPICSGGCANKRIENLSENADHDLCTIYNDNDGEALEELLYQYYLSTINKSKNIEI